MKTVKMTEGDILIETGRTEWLEEKECVRQRLMHALKLDKGSWFLGPDGGINWFSIYQQKALSEKLIRSNVERILKADTEVSAVNYITLDYDNNERRLTVKFEVDTIYGTVGGNV